jgi:Protein of unknown function (DUF1559)
MIRFTCSCGRQLQASDRQAGAAAACPMCGQVCTVPGPDSDSGLPEPARPAASSAAEAGRHGDPLPTPPTDGRTGKRHLQRPRVRRLDVFGLLLLVLLAGTAGIAVLMLPHTQGHPALTGETIVAGKLRQIVLSMTTYALAKGKLPAACSRGPDGKPLLSWRVLILPYIEEEELYARFHLDEPWDSPHNIALLSKTPATFADDKDDPSTGLTRFQVYVGPGTAFEGKEGHAVNEIADGTSRTVLVVEGEEAVPWTKPADLPFGPEVVLVRPHKRGSHYLVVSADASVHKVPADTPEETLRALITRKDGENVDWP